MARNKRALKKIIRALWKRQTAYGAGAPQLNMKFKIHRPPSKIYKMYGEKKTHTHPYLKRLPLDFFTASIFKSPADAEPLGCRNVTARLVFHSLLFFFFRFFFSSFRQTIYRKKRSMTHSTVLFPFCLKHRICTCLNLRQNFKCILVSAVFKLSESLPF